jgi:hypothetical protein
MDVATSRYAAPLAEVVEDAMAELLVAAAVASLEPFGCANVKVYPTLGVDVSVAVNGFTVPASTGSPYAVVSQKANV